MFTPNFQFLHDCRYDVAEFLGIPFAEPPTGANRFKRPVKLTRFKQNPLNAQKFGPGCPQNIDETFKNTSRYSDRERAASEMWNVMHQSEDCLSVNVWTPYPFQIQKSAALRPGKHNICLFFLNPPLPPLN